MNLLEGSSIRGILEGDQEFIVDYFTEYFNISHSRNDDQMSQRPDSDDYEIFYQIKEDVRSGVDTSIIIGFLLFDFNTREKIVHIKNAKTNRETVLSYDPTKLRAIGVNSLQYQMIKSCERISAGDGFPY